MRTLKVTFRAVFRQPQGVLNPMGCTFPGLHAVEIFGTGERWQAREIATARRTVYEKLGKFASLDHAKQQVETAFQERVEPWQPWGIPPMEATENRDQIARERLLLPDEICDLGNGQWGWLTAKDRTHIMHAPAIPNGHKGALPTACGETLPAHCYISTKANIRPTCQKCAEVWEKEYRGK